MKFGFGHVPAENYKSFVELVQLAEELGFDFAWVPDQTFYRDPYVIMAALALSTSRINIGLGVTNPYTRHPAMAARAVGALNEMAPGRIHLGIGAGNRKELIHPLGLDGSHPGEKCREMAEIVKGLLSGKEIQHEGEHFRARGIVLNFDAGPEIPVYIAGRGALVLQAAGQSADGAIIGGLCTPKGIDYALRHIEYGASLSGRDMRRMEIVSWVTIQITDRREQVLENIRPVVAHIVGGAPLEVLKAVDLPMEIVDKIKGAYTREGSAEAAKFITEEFIDAFTIIGDSQSCINRIQALSDAGVTQLSMLMPPAGVQDQQKIINRFADVIFPEFK